MSRDAPQYQMDEGQSAMGYTQWQGLCLLGISRSGRCCECGTRTVPECWHSSRNSLWQTPGCRCGDSRVQAWQTSVGSCGMSSVRNRKREVFHMVSRLSGWSIGPRRSASPADWILSLTESPCWLNVHPVSKLLGPLQSAAPHPAQTSHYTENDKGYRSIRLLSFSAINLGI